MWENQIEERAGAMTEKEKMQRQKLYDANHDDDLYRGAQTG